MHQLVDQLHAFGHHTHVEVVRQRDDGAHDDGVVGAVADVVDEASVDLEAVDRQRADVAQAGEAASIVIQGNVDAQSLQMMQHGVGHVHRFHQTGLGDLDLDQLARQVVPVQEL